MIKRIEICGGIGSGKTTLAQQFENNNYYSLYENFGNNPFLQNFYSDTFKYAFETETTFSLQRFHALKAADKQNLWITDCSLEQDYAYAKNNLTAAEFCAFSAVFSEIMNQIGPATLVVYLKCSTDTLLKRIETRSRGMEQTISSTYLDGMISALEDRLNTGVANYIIIDSETMDFRNKEIFVAVKEKILNKMPLQ